MADGARYMYADGNSYTKTALRNIRHRLELALRPSSHGQHVADIQHISLLYKKSEHSFVLKCPTQCGPQVDDLLETILETYREEQTVTDAKDAELTALHDVEASSSLQPSLVEECLAALPTRIFSNDNGTRVRSQPLYLHNLDSDIARHYAKCFKRAGWTVPLHEIQIVKLIRVSEETGEWAHKIPRVERLLPNDRADILKLFAEPLIWSTCTSKAQLEPSKVDHDTTWPSADLSVSEWLAGVDQVDAVPPDEAPLLQDDLEPAQREESQSLAGRARIPVSTAAPVARLRSLWRSSLSESSADSLHDEGDDEDDDGPLLETLARLTSKPMHRAAAEDQISQPASLLSTSVETPSQQALSFAHAGHGETKLEPPGAFFDELPELIGAAYSEHAASSTRTTTFSSRTQSDVANHATRSSRAATQMHPHAFAKVDNLGLTGGAEAQAAWEVQRGIISPVRPKRLAALSQRSSPARGTRQRPEKLPSWTYNVVPDMPVVAPHPLQISQTVATDWPELGQRSSAHGAVAIPTRAFLPLHRRRDSVRPAVTRKEPVEQEDEDLIEFSSGSEYHSAISDVDHLNEVPADTLAKDNVQTTEARHRTMRQKAGKEHTASRLGQLRMIDGSVPMVGRVDAKKCEAQELGIAAILESADHPEFTAPVELQVQYGLLASRGLASIARSCASMTKLLHSHDMTFVPQILRLRDCCRLYTALSEDPTRLFTSSPDLPRQDLVVQFCARVQAEEFKIAIEMASSNSSEAKVAIYRQRMPVLCPGNLWDCQILKLHYMVNGDNELERAVLSFAKSLSIEVDTTSWVDKDTKALTARVPRDKAGVRMFEVTSVALVKRYRQLLRRAWSDSAEETSVCYWTTAQTSLMSLEEPGQEDRLMAVCDSEEQIALDKASYWQCHLSMVWNGEVDSNAITWFDNIGRHVTKILDTMFFGKHLQTLRQH